MKYTIVEDKTGLGLVQKVRDYMTMDWTPIGGVCVVDRAYDAQMYYQAMVKSNYRPLGIREADNLD